MRLLSWAVAKVLRTDRPPRDPQLRAAPPLRRSLPPPQPTQVGMAVYPNTRPGTVVWFPEPPAVPQRIGGR